MWGAVPKTGLVVPMLLLVMAGGALGRIIYVDADAIGANNGYSWSDAYIYLQDALADANLSGDVNEIRVAQGIYRPDQNSVYPDGTGVRETTFQLINGVSLKGRYAGFGEPDPNERNIQLYETVLSGDLNGDDGPDFDDYDENSYHVVTGSGTNEWAILDGFTITGGNANGSWEQDYDRGGGMYNDGGSPRVTDCNFTWNWAGSSGGGVFNGGGSSPRMVGCTFASNSANSYGGGMYNHKSSPVLTNCTFSYNSCCYFGFCFWRCTGAGVCSIDSNSTLISCTFNGNWLGSMQSNRGAGVYSFKGRLTLKNCMFSENRALSVFGTGFETDHAGGGVCMIGAADAKVVNCIFIGNSANIGGGIFNKSATLKMTNCTFMENSANHFDGGAVYSSGSPTFTDCRFINNSANDDGGGVYNSSGSYPILNNCTFANNQAGFNGGGICSFWSRDSEVINCTFSGNSAGGAGGGMYNESHNPNLVNCTFCGNSAGSSGGAMYNKYTYGGIGATLTNCILWGDTPEEIGLYTHSIGLPLITYCNVEGGWQGERNIDADPCFVNPDGNDYHLRPDSPCIDAGDNSRVPEDMLDLDGDGNTTEPIPWDFDGNARIVDGNNDCRPVVDMGAYEYFVPPTEVAMKLTPQALNLGSKGNWVKAHCVLPEGYTVEDVDVNTPVTLELLGIEIESDYINVFVNEDDLVEVEIAFERGAFCGVETNDEFAEATVTGSLTCSRRFRGTDTIKIVSNKFNCLAVLASYWLEEDCGKPDWCGGADVNQDSIVNFFDFALLDPPMACCIEILTQ